jgi:serine/threonine-protein phosphatase 4 regulatory subunit 4
MSSPSSQVDELFSSIIASLVKYHACIKTDWRRLDSFYAHFDTFGNYFTAEQIGTTIIPMLRVEIVSSCAIPLKEKATNAIVVMVRYLKNVTRQVEIFNELWKELGENKSYWHRMTYLELFHCIWKHFSRRFVKEHAFSDVMKLSSDPVANVRLKFCKLLPELKQVLQLPNDVQLLATLKETVSYLSLDKDRDVVSAAQKAQQALLAIDNEINRGHRQNLQTLEDRTDNEREREETLWMEIELENEKAKKREAMQLNVDPVKPPSADSKTTPNGTSNLIAKPVPKPVPKGQVGNAKTVPKVVSPPPPTGSKSPTKQ